MVSFSCEACGDVLTKKSLDKHKNQCRGASFTCLDCMVHFHGTDYRSHTSCISEAQKYQGHLYREKSKGKADKRNYTNGADDSQAMVPRRAYVEDAPDGDDSQAIAIIDVPPRAPTPPSAIETPSHLPENVNVFDFLVTDETPNGSKTALVQPQTRRSERSVHFGNPDSHSQFSQFSTDYMEYGFSYGNTPVNPSISRYDSWQNLTDAEHSQALMPPPAYVTPAPKEHRKERREANSADKSSDKKRKRHHVEELDLSSSKRPSSRDEMMLDGAGETSNGRVLHSGLTGGLQKLITDPEFYDDRIEAGPTPILSPIKRTRREDDSKKDRRKTVYVSHVTSNPSKSGSTKNVEEKQRRPRSPERRYHDDKYRSRARSADKPYHDDRHRHRKHRESTSSDERPQRKQLKAIEYPDRPSSVQPNGSNQLVTYKSRADLFMSFITKGPDSERGCSINKVLKRYHRERDVRGEAKDDEDKELWKSMRLRRNERGEIVLFI